MSLSYSCRWTQGQFSKSVFLCCSAAVHYTEKASRWIAEPYKNRHLSEIRCNSFFVLKFEAARKSVQFKIVIYSHGKASMCFIRSLSSVPRAAFKQFHWFNRRWPPLSSFQKASSGEAPYLFPYLSPFLFFRRSIVRRPYPPTCTCR